MKDVIKGLVRESMDFHIVETLMGEDYPSSFDIAHFRTLKTFSQRVQYCQQNLRRISSGSSRIVYMVDDTKVLKLAKNNKGIQQNLSEMDWKDERIFENILAQVLDCQENGLWVEMELARKVTPNIFKQFVGVSMADFEEYITYQTNRNNGKRVFFTPKPEIIAILDENMFTQDVMTFIDSSDAINVIGDFGKLNSYGLVKRDGKDQIVLIDFGLTDATYDSYYK